MKQKKEIPGLRGRAVSVVEELAGARLAPGLEVARTIRWDHDAEPLELEIRVLVRRAPLAPDKAAELRAAVLADLRERPILVKHCGCDVAPRRGGFGTSRRPCDGRIVAAVVYQAGGRRAVLFVCGHHRTTHRIPVEQILASVELTAGDLTEARRLLTDYESRLALQVLAEDHAAGDHKRTGPIRACPACNPPENAVTPVTPVTPKGADDR